MSVRCVAGIPRKGLDKELLSKVTVDILCIKNCTFVPFFAFFNNY